MPSRFEVRDLTAADAAEIAQWRYEGPWSIYDLPADAELRAEDGYFAVSDVADGRLVGFCCHGVEARVPGLEAAPGMCDVGVGMDPALTGRGNGEAFGRAALEHLRTLAAGDRLRAAVQTWNQRSLRLTRRLGFAPIGVHRCVQNGGEVEYTVLAAH